MKRNTWRSRARPIIYRIIQQHGDSQCGLTLRKALREAYPFGSRKYWPYKVWLDEIKRQTGRKRKKGPAVETQGRLFT